VTSEIETRVPDVARPEEFNLRVAEGTRVFEDMWIQPARTDAFILHANVLLLQFTGALGFACSQCVNVPMWTAIFLNVFFEDQRGMK
jgi:hypothetical protein